jgi:hypothetical protein
MRIFERTTFLLLRCCSVHVKLCVWETYSARNWVLKSCWHGLRQHCTAVSPMSGSPTFDTEKKHPEIWGRRIYNSATPYGLRAGGVITLILLNCARHQLPHIVSANNSKTCWKTLQIFIGIFLSVREWTENGQLWVQQVSSTPATRLDVVNLQVKQMLRKTKCIKYSIPFKRICFLFKK